MNFYRALRTGVVSLLVLVLLCSLWATASASASAVQNQTNGAVEEPENIENQLIDLLVREVEYADGEFTITVEWTGTTPESMTLTEMIQLDGSGSQSISMQTVRLYPGETTEITMSASKRSDGTAAVILSTRQSIEQGDALVLQEGEPQTAREPVPFSLAAVMVLATAGLSIGGTLSYFRRKMADEEATEEQVL